MAGYKIAGPAGRTQEFAGGQDSTGTQQATVMTQKPQKQAVGFKPSSALDVMQQAGYHPNDGNSTSDAARQTFTGQLPSANGSSPSTYDAEDPQMKQRLAA
jgi:hypothetical protein